MFILLLLTLLIIWLLWLNSKYKTIKLKLLLLLSFSLVFASQFAIYAGMDIGDGINNTNIDNQTLLEIYRWLFWLSFGLGVLIPIVLTVFKFTKFKKK